MKKRTFMKRMALMGVMVLGMSLFTGCGASSTKTASIPQRNAQPGEMFDSGVLLLKVNPEIAVEYDKEGKVISVEGRNDDGKEIVKNYKDYIGKDCRKVVGELVKAIHKAGYFVEDADGENKKITLEVEKGSVMPDENFLDEIAEDVQECVEEIEVNSQIVIQGDSDYDADDKDDLDDKDEKTDYGVSAYDADDADDKDDIDDKDDADDKDDLDDADDADDKDDIDDKDDADDKDDLDDVDDADDKDDIDDKDDADDKDDLDDVDDADDKDDLDDVDDADDKDDLDDDEPTPYGESAYEE